MKFPAAILSLSCLVACAFTVPARAASPAGGMAVPPDVAPLLEKFCYKCHKGDDAEADVRLNTLSSLEKGPFLNVLNKAESQLFFSMMPPVDARQPTSEERQLLFAWMKGELRKNNASELDLKARFPDAGNWVDHRTLFNGSIKDKPFSPARRWLVSPQIFWQRVFDVFEFNTKERDAHKNGLFGVTNPFILPEHSGVRDYDLTTLNGGHLLTMLNNAEWISKKQIRPARVKNGELKADEFESRLDRFVPRKTPAAFESVILKKTPPTDGEMQAAIQTQFETVLRRPPTAAELKKYTELLSSSIKLVGNTEGLRQMLAAVLLESEFVYRVELGDGPADAFGRKKLSQHEASFAIAYAIGDHNPDAALIAAAREGRLVSKTDYEREVRRLLADTKFYAGVPDPSLSNASPKSMVTHPKIIRFFREFFGYPMALRVFKDTHRSDGIYSNPDRGSSGTAGYLVDEADRVVIRIVESDKRVFETLLTTDQFFVYHNMDNDKGGKLIEGWRKVYEALKDTDWRKNPDKVAKDHDAVIRQYLDPKGITGKHSRNHDTSVLRVMPFFEHTFGRGGQPFTVLPWSFGNRYRYSSIYNLPKTPGLGGEYEDDGVFNYQPVQPFSLPNRKGILTHPAWLIAHSQNAATDPVRRGKWIREKLLAGSVPDVPITVDAKIPDDPHKTLGERLKMVTSKEECWKCHQRMNPLGIPFEMFDDFGRFRAAESLEHPDNIIAAAKTKYGAETYKTAAYSTAGNITGTGESAVDGEVKNALDMIDRLAKSERVRQSIIRHAFRFYMGRNEMLSDSQTLIDADRAYVKSGGSFKEVIVSFLTSDSFIYRK